MGEDGGVTLKIDADTARYIAGIARASQENKKLHDDMKGIGNQVRGIMEFGKDVAGRLAGWAGPISVAAAGMALVTKATEDWHRKLTSAREALGEIADLSQAIIGSGRGGETGAIRSAIDGAAPAMSGQQKAAFYQSYARSNPNASISAIGAAAGSANQASILGRDVGQFSDITGQLARAGVANSGDMANYLMANAGDGVDKATALIAKNPGQAGQIAQLFATATRGGRGAVSLLDRASSDFIGRGGKGDLMQSLNPRVAGAGGMDDLAFLLNPANRAPSFRPGGLDAAERQAMADPEVSVRVAARESKERAQDAAYGSMGGEARRRTLAESVVQEQDASHGWLYNAVRDIRGIIPLYAADRLDPTLTEKSSGYLLHAASETELRGILDGIRRNTNRQPLRPRVGANGEGAK